jgi:hypothetical protein
MVPLGTVRQQPYLAAEDLAAVNEAPGVVLARVAEHNRSPPAAAMTWNC